MTELNRVAVLGGTGNLGLAIARRLSVRGKLVVIGSRDEARAREVAHKLKKETPLATVEGRSNRDAAALADIVILTVPFKAHSDLLADIRDVVQGKILVDTTVPLIPAKATEARLPECGAVALRTQSILGSGVRVVATLHHVAAAKLAEIDSTIDCDVLICGDDPVARTVVSRLITLAGMDGVEAGPLANAVALESLTPILIWLNRNRRADGAGIRITGRVKSISNG